MQRRAGAKNDLIPKVTSLWARSVSGFWLSSKWFIRTRSFKISSRYLSSPPERSVTPPLWAGPLQAQTPIRWCCIWGLSPETLAAAFLRMSSCCLPSRLWACRPNRGSNCRLPDLWEWADEAFPLQENKGGGMIQDTTTSDSIFKRKVKVQFFSSFGFPSHRPAEPPQPHQLVFSPMALSVRQPRSWCRHLKSEFLTAPSKSYLQDLTVRSGIETPKHQRIQKLNKCFTILYLWRHYCPWRPLIHCPDYEN